MAAQDEREPGVDMCSNVLGPIAQDIPEQDIVMGELELPPQMDPKPKMAAVCDTSPSPPHQNPPPIPAESAQPSTAAMAQLVAILAGIENRMMQSMKKNNGCEHAGVQEQYAGTAG